MHLVTPPWTVPSPARKEEGWASGQRPNPVKTSLLQKRQEETVGETLPPSAPYGARGTKSKMRLDYARF